MDIHRLDSIRKLFLLPFAHFLRLSGFFLRRKKSGKAIAVFYTGKLGDMVCLTSVLEALKENNKDAKLIIFARSKFLAIWNNNPFIDERIGFINERNAGSISWIFRQWRLLNKFEAVTYFNLVNNFEGGILGLALQTNRRYSVTTRLDGRLNRLLYQYYSIKDYKFDRSIKEFYFELLSDAGMKAGNTANRIYFTGESAEADEFFRVNYSVGKIVIGAIVSSGKDYKVWPKEYWIQLLNQLNAEYQPIILLFGLKEDEAYLELIKRDLIGDVYLILGKGLDVLPYFIKKCQLFVSVDTGLLYIADALKVPVVDILGPCDDNNQRPENNYRLVTDRAICRPQCKMLFNVGIDAAEVKECFSAIIPEQVFTACGEFLPH